MGKHNKSARKEYLKRRRKRSKRKREEEASEEVNKDDEISTSTDHDSSSGQDSSESEAGSDILDPNDPEVMRRYSYPHPSNDRLLVGFYRFQENKRQKGPKNHAYVRHFCRSWYNGSYTMMAQLLKTLELHYSMIQFLII